MPKYHLVEGLSSKKMAGWIDSALPLAVKLEDLLPERVRERHHLLPIADAVRLGHRPDTLEQWRDARRRMAFAELFELQAAFALMRASIAAEPATPIPYKQEVIDAFKAGLGFELTRAQRRSTWEAFQDMEKTAPMNRLTEWRRRFGKDGCRGRLRRDGALRRSPIGGDGADRDPGATAPAQLPHLP